jgi:hypothetical protein
MAELMTEFTIKGWLDMLPEAQCSLSYRHLCLRDYKSGSL